MERRPLLAHAATAAVLAIAMAINVRLLWPYLAATGHDFDALHVYLPFARRLLAEGLSFFLAEESLQAPPFAYAYPALLGPDLAWLKRANVALSCLSVLLAYRTGSLWHSRFAGILAALALALSPLLKPYLATANTEPPFVLLLGIWIWALSEWIVRGRAGYVPIAGLALGLALLTRATLFYGVIAIALAYGVLALRSSAGARREARGTLVAHLIALALPAAFIVNNVAVFGFAFYATGGGNALYLGTHPENGGYDPNYLGLTYDVGAVTREAGHLTIAGDRMLNGVARIVLAGLDPVFLGQMYANKLGAFLFVTNAEFGNVLLWRSWRIAALILSVVGLFALRERRLRWIVGWIVLFQVAVHVPLLYTHRYSVGALDLWLALLAGVGVAQALGRGRPIEMAGLGLLVLAGILAGAWHWSQGGRPQPDHRVARHELVWESLEDDYRFDGERRAVEWDVRHTTGSQPRYNYVLAIEGALVPGKDAGSCGEARFAYRYDSEPDFAPARSVARRLIPDGRRREYRIGALVPLKMDRNGWLRLEVRCAPGSVLKVRRVSLYATQGALEWRERYLARRALASFWINQSDP